MEGTTPYPRQTAHLLTWLDHSYTSNQFRIMANSFMDNPNEARGDMLKTCADNLIKAQRQLERVTNAA